jgi:hypothetical protein
MAFYFSLLNISAISSAKENKVDTAQLRVGSSGFAIVITA